MGRSSVPELRPGSACHPRNTLGSPTAKRSSLVVSLASGGWHGHPGIGSVRTGSSHIIQSNRLYELSASRQGSDEPVLMWPWGHLALGYLCYSVFTRVVWGRPPEKTAVLLLIVVTQAPDLIDKPLAYQAAVLPEGRSLAHSLFVAIPVCVTASVVASQTDHHRFGAAVVVGYLTHPLGDAYGPMVRGAVTELRFLFWPVVNPPDYPADSFADHWVMLVESLTQPGPAAALTGVGPETAVSLGVGLGVVLLWYADGRPGFGLLTGRWPGDRFE
ncbi:MAG: putative membrane-bound metal-dependent hydrolase (DUF457) [uncultured archaeon A07HR60]|nr:MAG: putative membrane-bound metal-dependent hydrolase (DUF457) [uncultured archaeon A07HR60]